MVLQQWAFDSTYSFPPQATSPQPRLTSAHSLAAKGWGGEVKTHWQHLEEANPKDLQATQQDDIVWAKCVIRLPDQKFPQLQPPGHPRRGRIMPSAML